MLKKLHFWWMMASLKEVDALVFVIKCLVLNLSETHLKFNWIHSHGGQTENSMENLKFILNDAEAPVTSLW